MAVATSADGGQGTPPATPPAGGTPPAPAPDAWYASADDTTKGFIQNKGWKSPLEVIDGYRNLEKHVGVPAEKILRLPDEGADKATMDAFYGKLGRPAEAKQYEIKMPETGGDPAFAEWAKGVFHEIGLSGKQASALADKWNEYGAGLMTKQGEALKASQAEAAGKLKAELGAAFDKSMDVIDNVAKTFSMGEKELAALRTVLGPYETAKFLLKLGEGLGEDKFVSGGARQTGFDAMTPGQAQARMAQLKADKEWTARYLKNGVQEKAEMERLMKFAYPSEAA